MKQLKKKDISALHAILKGAKMTKGDTAGKLALVKAIIATKAEAEKHDNFTQTTAEKMQPEDFKEMQAKAQNTAGASIEEVLKLQKYFNDYNQAVADAIKAEEDKRVGVDLEPWSEEQFSALLESNDFNGAQMLLLHQTLRTEDKKAKA